MSSSTTDATPLDVTMPQMGTSVAEGTVVAWSKQVGDRVEADEVICEISTDKIDSEVPSPAAGTLQEILVPVGETVDVGTVLARIATAGTASAGAGSAGPANAGTANAESPSADRAGGAGEDDSATPLAESPRPATGPARSTAGARPSSARHSPVVQRVAVQHGVDLSLVSGTGRNGRITKKDVLAWIAQGGNGTAPAEEQRPLHSESPYRPDPPATAPAATPGATTAPPVAPDDPGGVAAPLSRMRQQIGTAMLRSQQTAATCTTIVECDVSRVERRRRELGITALPLIARATIETLREFPDLNATLDGTTLTRYERVHLGIAVSLGDDGLIVPVIHDAQELSPEGLAGRIKDLARRARSKQLTPDDVQGATFTITNPGQFGALMATPVIAQPQVAILDLEAIVKRPVVVTGPAGEDAIAIRPLVNLCMSWDHRALDGVYAARFLTALQHRLEDA